MNNKQMKLVNQSYNTPGTALLKTVLLKSPAHNFRHGTIWKQRKIQNFFFLLLGMLLLIHTATSRAHMKKCWISKLSRVVLTITSVLIKNQFIPKFLTLGKV